MSAIQLREPDGRLAAAFEAPDRPGLFDAVASWCECLQGRKPLLAVLQDLAEGLGAQAACLSRLSHGGNRTARVVAWNAAAARGSAEKVTRSFAASVLGRYVDRPRAGSVWFSSLMEDGADPAIAVFQRRARLKETAIVALSGDGKWTDFLEFHFARRPGNGTVGLLNMIAGTLSRTWVGRTPGLFSDALLAAQAESRLGFRDPLLSLSNPARLSRAEFRVCLLLSRGLNATAVCAELGITGSTLKTHLRSIFAKTETTSLAELLFQLLTPPRADSAEAPLLRRA